ncbi:nitrate reductase [Gimibacter soli]|uniref:Molybdopterin-dependent oxidoreductase n=1 Tax=Gimibacter soli TaxID=3024400 RepID=A0AAE9XNF5_9PROT|nr:nitrate reductase [Gimibacter soli]WCL53366.1 molybdopterin-dependent oxidoreductase [Gimibacter soli]
MTITRTTCAYCGVGCGIIATEMEGGVRIEGDPSHPANRGRLCSKGLALGQTLDHASRLAFPTIDGVRVSWDTATRAVADRLTTVINEHGPDAVAFYVSGQLLTEDYYVANKLMKGFIGSANIDTNSRLCMASTVAGHTRAFGGDIVPGDYADLEEADLVVLVGSNLAWCHPVLFQRLRAAREARGTRVVVIDPRRTESCDIADLHIPVMPDGDVLLFNGLLAHLDACGTAPAAFTGHHVDGYAGAVAAARSEAPALAAAIATRGIEAEVAAFYRLFAATEKVVTVFSQGVNQAHNGTDRVNAIINCHLATGRIGRPGMGPFSVTGQPNAMGGREVGGLASMLAAHMGFSDHECDLVQGFWQSPAIPRAAGLRAVDMFDAVHDGRIKAIWIMATNPAVSLPQAAKVREALARCPTVIVSDCVKDTDTQAFAHIRLPATGWSEKDGTVTNSDRTISRQRAFRAPYAEARPDWQIICDVATAMGHGAAFAYESPADIFREHAALSAHRNEGSRAFDIGALANIGAADYNTLAPTKWPQRAGERSQTRLFGNGAFFTPDARARMVALDHRPSPAVPSPDYPLLLNTGRYRDQWHTMTRTGLAPSLTGHRPEPLLDVSPTDARSHGLADKGFATVASPRGRVVVRVRVTDDQKPGELFLPMHWSETHASAALVGTLIAPEVDPLSKQPAFKSTAVSLAPAAMSWRGLLLSRSEIEIQMPYWTRTQLKHATLTRIAGYSEADFAALRARLEQVTGDTASIEDGTGLRLAGFEKGQLAFILFAGESLAGIDLGWADSQFEAASLEDSARRQLLAGRSPGAVRDTGPVVCSCFQVGQNTIRDAICKGRLTSTDGVRDATGAGGNCGSCIPEIKALIARE